MFRSATTKIAHNATFSSLGGNKDLRLLQDMITAEKSILQSMQRLSIDFARAADALKNWGAGEGEDLTDVTNASYSLLSHFSSALNEFAIHEEAVRTHMKAVRTREESLDEMKRRRRAVGAKADSAEKKLNKMSPEHKNLAVQTDILQKLQDEIRQLDSEIMTEESRLGDFKRTETKNWMALKFGGLLELSEKGAMAGEFGKMVIQHIPLELTQPGLPRAFYGSHPQTRSLVDDAQRSISQVAFSASPSSQRPDTYMPRTDTSGFQPSGAPPPGAPPPAQLQRHDSTLPEIMDDGPPSRAYLPPPQLGPIDATPLGFGHLMEPSDTTTISSAASRSTFLGTSAGEFGTVSPGGPGSAQSSHFRMGAGTMNETPMASMDYIPHAASPPFSTVPSNYDTDFSPAVPEKGGSTTVGPRAGGGPRGGGGRFATFPVKGARPRTDSSQSGTLTPTAGPVPLSQSSSFGTARNDQPRYEGYQLTDGPMRSSLSSSTPTQPLSHLQEETTTSLDNTIGHPEAHQVALAPLAIGQDQPPALNLGRPEDDFSSSIAAALAQGFDSDEEDNRAAPQRQQPLAVLNPKPQDDMPTTPTLAYAGPPSPVFAPPPGPPPVVGKYAPPPGPPPSYVVQARESSISEDSMHSPLPSPTFGAPVQGSFFPLQHGRAGPVDIAIPSDNVPTAIEKPAPMPPLVERPTAESVLQRDDKANTNAVRDDDVGAQASYMAGTRRESTDSSSTASGPASRASRHVRFGDVSDVDEELQLRERRREEDEIEWEMETPIGGTPSGPTKAIRGRDNAFPRSPASPQESPLSSPVTKPPSPPPLLAGSAAQANNRPMPPEMDEQSLNAAAAREVSRELDSLTFLPPPGPPGRAPSPLLPPAAPFASGKRAVTPRPSGYDLNATPTQESVPPPPPQKTPQRDTSQPNTPTSPTKSPTSPMRSSSPSLSSPARSRAPLPPPPSISLPRPNLSPTSSADTPFMTPLEYPVPPRLSPAPPFARTSAPSSPTLPSSGGKISAGAFRRAQARAPSGGAPGSPFADTSPLSIAKRSLPSSPHPQQGMRATSPLAPLVPPPPLSTPLGQSGPLAVPGQITPRPGNGDSGVRPKSTNSTAGSDYEFDYISAYVNEDAPVSPVDEQSGARRVSGHEAGKFSTNSDGDSGLR